MPKKQTHPFDQAVVALANHYQFDARTVNTGSCVQSRLLLWCKAGAGAVRVNRRRISFQPGDFVLFPWGHDTTYYPDPADPFFVGGVHIIPRHARTKPLTFFVPHAPDAPLFHCSYRGDLPQEVLPDWIAGSFDAHPAIGLLAEYIVSWYQRGDLAEAPARRLGETLLEELARLGKSTPTEEARHTPRIKQMIKYVQNHPEECISIEQFARIGHCSPATVYRLFEKTFQQSPVEWLIGWRIREAARLLSTTSLPVGEVGRRVGVEDPYYFSKLFRRHMSMTAGEYRKRNSLA